MNDRPTAPAFGPNAWLVDEMYEQYLADPASVSESWREFRSDYRRPPGGDSEPEPRAEPAPERPAEPAARPQDAAAVTLTGAQARIAANMAASLEVPTATSARVVPAKLLEVNRRILNNHLGHR